MSNSNVRICVLGAGIAGLTTAYQLSSLGVEVVVIEQEAQAAMGASYANGAQISVSNAIPIAHPSVFFYFLKSRFKGEGGLFFKAHLSLHEWCWLYHFMRNCRTALSESNLIQLAKLCVRSRELYYRLIAQLDIQFDFSKTGILHFYSDATAYRIASRQAALLRTVSPQIRSSVDREQIIAIEPALKKFSDSIVGGFYSSEDAIGDARLFCIALERLCRQRGVEFLYDQRVQNLKLKPQKILIQMQRGDCQADRVVCCLGAYSPIILRKVGVSVAIYPLKGYSITIDLADAAAQYAPKVSLLDDQYRLVASRLGQRLRVAGIAELDNYRCDINPKRIAYLKRWVAMRLPGIPIDHYTSWAGLRPATPSNLPYVGKTHHPCLWLNTGHGTLGWTAAMATAETVTKGILASI